MLEILLNIKLDKKCVVRFRLWLTSGPYDKLPVRGMCGITRSCLSCGHCPPFCNDSTRNRSTEKSTMCSVLSKLHFSGGSTNSKERTVALLIKIYIFFTWMCALDGINVISKFPRKVAWIEEALTRTPQQDVISIILNAMQWWLCLPAEGHTSSFLRF